MSIAQYLSRARWTAAESLDPLDPKVRQVWKCLESFAKTPHGRQVEQHIEAAEGDLGAISDIMEPLREHWVTQGIPLVGVSSAMLAGNLVLLCEMQRLGVVTPYPDPDVPLISPIAWDGARGAQLGAGQRRRLACRGTLSLQLSIPDAGVIGTRAQFDQLSRYPEAHSDGQLLAALNVIVPLVASGEAYVVLHYGDGKPENRTYRSETTDFPPDSPQANSVGAFTHGVCGRLMKLDPSDMRLFQERSALVVYAAPHPSDKGQVTVELYFSHRQASPSFVARVHALQARILANSLSNSVDAEVNVRSTRPATMPAPVRP